MLQFLTGVKLTTFAVGAVTGAITVKVLGSQTARKFAVNTLAKGYQIKDAANEKYQNIKEEAQDICAEAKAEASAFAMSEEPEDEIQ
ncbi:MAG: DUF6110 family protein [Eubacteriales bacterium]